MDAFVPKRKPFAPPTKKKAPVSIADLMRANAKPAPFAENGASVMGGLGAASLARVAEKLKKVKEPSVPLSEQQREVVECARAGKSVFFTGNAARGGVRRPVPVALRYMLYPPRAFSARSGQNSERE